MPGCVGAAHEAHPHELGDERDEIALDLRGRRVVLVAHHRDDVLQPAPLIDQLPHARADRVEAEIHAGGEVEDDRFAIELSKDNVAAHLQRGIEGDIFHGA